MDDFSSRPMHNNPLNKLCENCSEVQGRHEFLNGKSIYLCDKCKKDKLPYDESN